MAQKSVTNKKIQQSSYSISKSSAIDNVTIIFSENKRMPAAKFQVKTSRKVDSPPNWTSPTSEEGLPKGLSHLFKFSHLSSPTLIFRVRWKGIIDLNNRPKLNRLLHILQKLRAHYGLLSMGSKNLFAFFRYPILESLTRFSLNILSV